MNLFSRCLLAIIAGVALLGATACSRDATGGERGSGSGETTDSAESRLVKFDPCGFFTPRDLAAAGVAGPGEPVEQVDFEPGCAYEGEKLLVTLYKNATETVGSYETNGSWDSYERIEINGRAAANGIGSGVTGQGGCSTLVDAGGGVVLVMVTGIMADDLPEPCATSQEIATRIEPRLPD